jgi:glycosyltransferase involved in cell wall biosynthesis
MVEPPGSRQINHAKHADPRIDLVLPCLDEAGALPWVLSRVPAGVRALVVDNGSTDGSAEVAVRLGATVVPAPRRGYGAACHAGLEASTAEFVAFCDCDASIDPTGLLGFARPLLDGQADLIVGRRRVKPDAAWPVHARMANRALARWLRYRSGAPVHDIGPLRIARRSALLSLDQRDRRSGYPLETIVLAAAAGWRIAESEFDYHPRVGRSKVTGTLRGSLQAVRDMAEVLARTNSARSGGIRAASGAE